ncbi:MAG: Transketolase 2 [Firmicutes bacterium]|nr:Transketolase 2 [Bacillota bacterium]
MNTILLREKAQLMRRLIMQSIAEAGSGHPGGSLSLAEIMSYLYFFQAKLHATDPLCPERDRIILSKGHTAPVLYAALAAKGYISEAETLTLRKLGSRLQGHPDMRKLPGVEMSTGSLGQGLSVANGLAMGLRLQGKPNKVYAILGDGELQEGQVWEAAMTAAHYKLTNLTAIVDYNGLQIDGHTSAVKRVEPLADKWQSFGWQTVTVDGHSFTDLYRGFHTERDGSPLVVIARTVKGKGVDYMENVADWHGKAPSREQARQYAEMLGVSKDAG